MSPLYWKTRYATRGARHRAWVKQQAKREDALRRSARPSLLGRLRHWLHRQS
jgi:hypothetical protein